jgi:hypothetical protein
VWHIRRVVRDAADPAVGDGGVRRSAGQAAELLLLEPEVLPEDADEDEEPDEDAGLLSEPLLDEEDEEPEESDPLAGEAVFAGLLLDDEPRLSLR